METSTSTTFIAMATTYGLGVVGGEESRIAPDIARLGWQQPSLRIGNVLRSVLRAPETRRSVGRYRF